MEKEVFYVDAKGYQTLLRELERLRKNFEYSYNKVYTRLENGTANNKKGGFDCEDVYSLMQIQKEIQLLEKKMERVEIITPKQNVGHVNVGDLIRVSIGFDEEETEDLWLRLVTYVGKREHNNILSVSTNSPMGKAILDKTVGEKVTYQIHDSFCNAHILEIIPSAQFVGLDDLLMISAMKEGEDSNIKVIKLAGHAEEKSYEGYYEIGALSEFGKKIYLKQIGTHFTLTYKGATYQITILSKLNHEEIEKNEENHKRILYQKQEN